MEERASSTEAKPHPDGVGPLYVSPLKALNNDIERNLCIHTRHLPLGPDVNLELLAHSAAGFSGADLANLSNEAGLLAARHSHAQVSHAGRRRGA